MNINSPYSQNPAEGTRPTTVSKSKIWRTIALVVAAVAVVAGGYFGWQYSQRGSNQEKLLKTARESFADDARYVSFGANYVFAIPQSFSIDESSLPGVQLIIPTGLSNLKIDNFEQLFDAAIVAVQPVTQVKANDNRGLKNYVKKTFVPDLKKSLSQEIEVKYSMPGKYQAATITAIKDGQTVRLVYIYGGAHPAMIVAREDSDAYRETVATLIGVEDATAKDEFEPIKKIVQSSLTLVQQSKIQELYDSGSADFKSKTNIKELTAAINNAKSFITRNIVVPGGGFQGDVFNGSLAFRSDNKDDQVGLGAILLTKVDGVWKLNGLSLPAAASATPTPAPAKKN